MQNIKNRIALRDKSKSDPATRINGNKNSEIPRTMTANIRMAIPVRKFFNSSKCASFFDILAYSGIF